MAGLPATFSRLLREAAAPYKASGWRTRGAGLLLHAPDGSWGQIVFSGAGRAFTQPRWPGERVSDLVAHGPWLRIGLTAGTCSPYLLRVVNGVDALKPPPARFVAAHTRVVWSVPIDLTQSGFSEPDPLDVRTPRAGPPYRVGIEVAPMWLADLLAQLVPATQALCSELAIYKWLRVRQDTFSLRYAFLLGRHLGLRDELPALEREADARAEREGLLPSRGMDRQTTYPQDWSHDRFMRFADSL